MSDNIIVKEIYSRYLALLHLPILQPSLENLTRLVQAQLMRVPFENISKLYRLKHNGLREIPCFEQHLEGIERFNFGGTCYANNYYFNRLLDYLGYDIKLCGADMANPDVHIVSIVRLDGREYIVDVGYGAPFYTPMPRDLSEDFAINFGDDRYVIKPQDESGRSRLDLYRGGQLKHGYIVNPIPREIEYFTEMTADSYRPQATFTNALLLVRFFENRSIVIHNYNLIESELIGFRTTKISDRDELLNLVGKHFGIPPEIITEAISMIGESKDAWD
jgi:arylamine N-acetyltransferase